MRNKVKLKQTFVSLYLHLYFKLAIYCLFFINFVHSVNADARKGWSGPLVRPLSNVPGFEFRFRFSKRRKRENINDCFENQLISTTISQPSVVSGGFRQTMHHYYVIMSQVDSFNKFQLVRMAPLIDSTLIRDWGN